MYLLGADLATADALVTAINKTGRATAYKTTPSWCGNDLFDIHVTDPAGTKKNAIDEWQKLTGIPDEETVGMGDSENDIPLFESVGFKIAVANATDSLKSLPTI